MTRDAEGCEVDSRTGRPAFKEKVPGWTEAQAIVDGHVVTSMGPGTSLQFALKLVEILYDKAKAEEIAGQMLTKVAAEPPRKVGF